MRVYRVEHKEEGIGPFNFRGDNWSHINNALSARGYSSRTEFPNIFEDFPLGSRVFGGHCGVPSVEAVYHWFTGVFHALKETGFVVRVYEVPDEYVRLGASERQVLFMKAAAAVIQEMTIEEFKASC